MAGMQTKTERELEKAHAAGSTVIVFDHPEFGRSEFVMGLRMASDSAKVMKATGNQLEAYMPHDNAVVGVLSLAVMWWLARCRSGEPDLELDEVMATLDEAGGLDWLDEGVSRVSPDDDDAPGELTDPTECPPKLPDTGQSP